MPRRAEYYSPIRKEDIYSDFLTNFDVHPQTAQLVRNTNENAVKVALRNLLLTNKYERPHKPNFGGKIRNYLFEPLTPQTVDAMKEEIKMTIENFEPRVNLIDVIISPFPDDSAVAITIVFSIQTNPDPVELELTLYRVR